MRNTSRDPSAGAPCMFEDKLRKQMFLEQSEQKRRQIDYVIVTASAFALQMWVPVRNF